MCLTLYLELRVAMGVFGPLTRTNPLPRTKSGNGCVWTLYLELRVAMDVFDPLPRTKSGNGCV